VSDVHGSADRVSIVVPLRDEEHHVEELVAGIAAQDFPGTIEVLVADGASSDRSVERLEAAAQRLALRITVIDNSKRLIPPALNACVRRSHGDFVVRMDCRARFSRDYVRRCVATAKETGAWNVGGVILPKGRTRAERAVACAMDSPFGGVGWTRHSGSVERVEVDTVYCGTFPRDAFSRIGWFDESLPWNEDEDFNLRLRLAGGRVVLDPAIGIPYIPRASLRSILVQNYRIGRGKVDVMGKHRRVLSARSIVPLAFVTSLATLAIGSARSRRARWLLGSELSLYAGSALGFASASIGKRREQRSLLPAVAITFSAMHFAWGIGMAQGCLSLAIRRRPRASATESAVVQR
jgi:glycosyltransferase involved in cell wall biosynthesis